MKDSKPRTVPKMPAKTVSIAAEKLRKRPESQIPEKPTTFVQGVKVAMQVQTIEHQHAAVATDQKVGALLNNGVRHKKQKESTAK